MLLFFYLPEFTQNTGTGTRNSPSGLKTRIRQSFWGTEGISHLPRQLAPVKTVTNTASQSPLASVITYDSQKLMRSLPAEMTGSQITEYCVAYRKWIPNRPFPGVFFGINIFGIAIIIIKSVGVHDCILQITRIKTKTGFIGKHSGKTEPSLIILSDGILVRGIKKCKTRDRS